MGNELSSADCDDPYVKLNDAVERGDLDAVKRFIEVDGLSPNGASGKCSWDHPLLGACVNASNDGGKDVLVARYLHSKGARGYGIATAVQMSDLERVRELADSGEEELAAGRACRLIRDCRSVDIARWLFEYAGADSDREEAYHVTKACELGDLERIKALATVPGFDINTGYLKAMPGCGENIVPYTTDADREKLNEELIKTYGRTCDTKCTQLVHPLQIACLQQKPFQPEVAAYLIKELGAHTDIKSAALGGDKKATLMANAVHLCRLEVIQFLGQQGAKALWENGEEAAATCLLDAAASRSGSGTEMLKFFLGDENRAKCFDLSCKDKFGRTPLNLACVLERGANVEFILQHGGKGVVVSSKDVEAACNHCSPAILTMLLDHGGTLPPNNEVVTMISFRDDDRALAVLKLLHSRGADLTAPYIKSHDGTTFRFFMLHDATLQAATSCIEFLFSIGADPDAIGCSPDHQKPGKADDWESNLDLKYSNIYGDGVSLQPSRVRPVKALFEQAREAKGGDKKTGKTSQKEAHGHDIMDYTNGEAKYGKEFLEELAPPQRKSGKQIFDDEDDTPLQFDIIFAPHECKHIFDDEKHIIFCLAEEENNDDLPTAISNHVMKEGKHYCTIKVSDNKEPCIIAGICRSMENFDREFAFEYEENMCPINNVPTYAQWDSDCHACAYNAASGKAMWAGWDSGKDDHKDSLKYPEITKWKGMETLSPGSVLGLLLNLENGTLTIYKDNRRLGVIKDGLDGSFCWFVGTFHPCQVEIMRGPVPRE